MIIQNHINMINTLIRDDCFNILPKIGNESVDLIFSDLPYGQIKAKWDAPLDLNKLWPQYKRIIKPNGCILMFAACPFDKILACSNLGMLKYEWIWEKTQATGFLNANIAPLKAHEVILVFYDKPPIYNPQKTQGHKPMNSGKKKKDVMNKTDVYGTVLQDMEFGGNTDRYPRDVLVFPSDKQTLKEHKLTYPAQKPLDLCEYMIRTYTNEGMLVLDNCMGSGTIPLAAKRLSRKYIGIELTTAGFETANRRFELNL